MQISQGAGTCSPFSMLWFIMKGNGIPGMAGRRVILFPANPASGMTHKSPLLRKPSRCLWLQREGSAASPRCPRRHPDAATLPQNSLSLPYPRRVDSWPWHLPRLVMLGQKCATPTLSHTPCPTVVPVAAPATAAASGRHVTPSPANWHPRRPEAPPPLTQATRLSNNYLHN